MGAVRGSAQRDEAGSSVEDDEQRGFHYTLSASISSNSWCDPNEREDLIRQAHDECQGDIQSRDVAIVKVADLPANSGAPNRDRLVSHHVRSPTQTDPGKLANLSLVSPF